MSILDKIGGLLGGGLGPKIAEIIGNRIENKQQAELIRLEIEKAIGERAHELEMALLTRDAQIASEQSKTNQIEAGSDSLLKSGWRPMVGWVCVAALAYQMVFRPLLAWGSAVWQWLPPPSLEMDTLLTLLFAILGLGAYRTYERVSHKLDK
jgi:hypothetical protein